MRPGDSIMNTARTIFALGAFLAAVPLCEAQQASAVPWYRDPAYYASATALGSYAPGFSVGYPVRQSVGSYYGGYGSFAGGSAYGADRFVGDPISANEFGISSLMRSAGIGYDALTHGMMNFESARSKYIDNALKWQQVLYARRHIIGQYRSEMIGRRLATTQKWLDYKQTHPDANVPGPLTKNQVDPSTGAITWPAALRGPDFAEERMHLEELMMLRAHTSASAEVGRKIRTIASAMQQKLQARINDFTASEYVAARNVLGSLQYYEGGTGLALNAAGPQ